MRAALNSVPSRCDPQSRGKFSQPSRAPAAPTSRTAVVLPSSLRDSIAAFAKYLEPCDATLESFSAELEGGFLRLMSP
jgi:hypothetical protein